MKTSEAGIAFIKKAEGLYLTAYYCQAGELTIGYGHTNRTRTQPPVAPGLTITAEQADWILRNDLLPCEARVSKHVGIVPQAMFDMLVSFEFNCGGIVLSDGSPSGVTRAARTGNVANVNRELARWVYYRDPKTKVLLVSPGLVNRRNAEVAYILMGCQQTVDKQVAPNAAPAIGPWATDVEPAPQVVEEPPGPKPMYQSPTGNVSTGLGVGGTAQLGVDVAQAAQKPTWIDFAMTLATSYTFWIAVGTIAGAAYLWLGHRHRLRWGYA